MLFVLREILVYISDNLDTSSFCFGCHFVCGCFKKSNMNELLLVFIDTTNDILSSAISGDINYAIGILVGTFYVLYTVLVNRIIC